MRTIRLLLVVGYDQGGIDELVRAGIKAPDVIYREMLDRVAHPHRIEATVVVPTASGASLDSGVGVGDFDAVAWTGSSLHIHERTGPIPSQIELARACFRAGVPQFGSCWGAQIAAVASGGEVASNMRGIEVGVARKIVLSPEGRGHPMYAGKAGSFDAPCFHNDEIRALPSGSAVLSSNGHSQVQALTIQHEGGRFWAVQYHPEFDLEMIAQLMRLRAAGLIRRGLFADDDALEAHTGRLLALHQDPSRVDIKHQLGIDEDITNPAVREMEARNWITSEVLPALG